ncbi:MAG: hypothetical protein ACJAYP_000966 [Flavobacterium sp.]|jgi:hypothetical protein
MKRQTILRILLVLLIFNFSFSQESIIEFKTTDLYLIELPTSGEYYHKSILTEWRIDLMSKNISYKKENESFFFIYTDYELVKNENEEITIRFESKNEEIYMSSVNNFCKVIHYSKMDAFSNPRSYKNAVTYVNYELESIFDIMNYNIN